MEEEKSGSAKINYLVRSKECCGEYAEKYTKEGWEAKRSGKNKICWITGTTPLSLLFTFDLHVFLPELDGLGAGVAGEAVKYQTIAEGKGYPVEICSYARANLGRLFSGLGEAEGEYPPPDFLVCFRTNCTTYFHWWEMLSRYYNVPLFTFDAPFWNWNRDEPIPRQYEEYYIKRLHELIAFLEEQTGQKYDHDRYMQNIRYELESHRRWEEIIKYTQMVPTPATDFDLCFPMLALAWWRGTEIVLDLYKEVKEELDDRVKKGITAIPNEKHRLILMSNPPWFRMELLPEWLAEVNTVIVASAITQMGWDWSRVGEGSPEEVLRALANSTLNYNIAQRVKWAEEIVREWKCDSMALMDNRGCKAFAFVVPEMMAELEKNLGLPCFRFEGNMNDPREFNDAQVRAQFETFVELLDQR